MDISRLEVVAKLALSVSSFFVSLSALTISWLVYRRDVGRLEVYVTVSEVLGGTPFRKISDMIYIRVVNSGRRTVSPVKLAGDTRWARLRQTADWICRKDSGVRRSFLFDSPNIRTAFAGALSEGEQRDLQFPLPEFSKALDQLASARRFYVIDTLGRRHLVKRRILRQLRKGRKAYLAERGNTQEGKQ
jgi:hypothetical protein